MINRKKCIDKMTDRIPLIVNPDASQIQELPNADDLVLSGELKLTGTSGATTSDIHLSGGSDSVAVIGVTGTSGTLSRLRIDCQKNNNSGDLQVAEFNVGASDKIEFVSKGEITAVQPTCLLTVPKEYVANNADTGSGHPQEGGTNEKPISFANETTNVNCTTSRASNATVNSGITSITVPSAGTYLVTASVSGINTSTNSNNTSTNKDQVRLCLGKTGITTFPNVNTFPASIFASDFGAEFNMNFALPLPLSANDALSIHFSHIGTSKGSIQEGHFSVTKLH